MSTFLPYFYMVRVEFGNMENNLLSLTFVAENIFIGHCWTIQDIKMAPQENKVGLMKTAKRLKISHLLYFTILFFV